MTRSIPFSRRAEGHIHLGLVLVLLAWPKSSSASIPYTPLRLFSIAKQDQSVIYLLDGPSNSLPSGQLSALTLGSSTLSSNRISPSVVSSTLPFLQSNSSIAYSASTQSLENRFQVLAGDCAAGPSGVSVWTFTADDSSSSGDGTWSQEKLDPRSTSAATGESGAQYLASALSFAPVVGSNATIYTFGGMCPEFRTGSSSGTASDEWQSQAIYSSQLTSLSPEADSTYAFALGDNRGGPIAEAGYSLTPLSPTFSNNSDGSQSQQQDFLLLGGHTQQAFINMSQVAILSLPQQSWTFLPVTNEDAGSGDLVRRQLSEVTVEPRSGHTALLTSDGARVIMYGGWVGNTSTPAEPQLAILEVGAGYGGPGQWSWADTAAQPSLSAAASGIYAHGAIMLPGDVMMITGGLTIPSGGTTQRVKRQSSASSNAQTLFYNVSGNEWISSYDPSQSGAASASKDSSSGVLSSKQEKVGLGVGLSLGILAVGLAAFACWYIARRMRRQRNEEQEQETREKEYDEFGNLVGPYFSNGLGINNADGDRGSPVALGLLGGSQRSRTSRSDYEPSIWRGDSVREAERSGMDLDIPSPHRGLRRSVSGRSYHHIQTSRFDESSLSRGGTIMGRIDEHEEESEETRTVNSPRETADIEDPFRDPPQNYTPTTPDGTTVRRISSVPKDHDEEPFLRSRDRENTPDGVVLDDNPPHIPPQLPMIDLITGSPTRSLGHGSPEKGRSSPSKSERTLSTLSMQSITSAYSSRSAVSALSVSVGERIDEEEMETVPLNQSTETTIQNGSTGGAFAFRKGRSLRLWPGSLPQSNISGTLAEPGSPSRSHGRSSPRTPGTAGTNTTTGADSFATAPGSREDLQSESDNLLSSERHRQANRESPSLSHKTLPPIRTMALTEERYHDNTIPNLEPDSEPTFMRMDPSPSSPWRRGPSAKMGSWVGSLRRAVNVAGGRSTSLTSASARAGLWSPVGVPTHKDVGPDGLGGFMIHQGIGSQGGEGSGSTQSSPTKRGGFGIDVAGGVTDATAHASSSPLTGPSSALRPALAPNPQTGEGRHVYRSFSDGAGLLAANRVEMDSSWDSPASNEGESQLSPAQETREGHDEMFERPSGRTAGLLHNDRDYDSPSFPRHRGGPLPGTVSRLDWAEPPNFALSPRGGYSSGGGRGAWRGRGPGPRGRGFGPGRGSGRGGGFGPRGNFPTRGQLHSRPGPMSYGRSPSGAQVDQRVEGYYDVHDTRVAQMERIRAQRDNDRLWIASPRGRGG